MMGAETSRAEQTARPASVCSTTNGTQITRPPGLSLFVTGTLINHLEEQKMILRVCVLVVLVSK